MPSIEGGDQLLAGADLGIEHVWNDIQRYWHPRVEADGRTNLSKVFVAGDGAFVHGAKAAELRVDEPR